MLASCNAVKMVEKIDNFYDFGYFATIAPPPTVCVGMWKCVPGDYSKAAIRVSRCKAFFGC